MAEKLLSIKNLHTSFYCDIGEIKAVRGVSFDLHKGEAIGIVGESGSGKSVTSQAIMKLLQVPGKIKEGEVIFKGENLVDKTNKEMSKIRGNEIAMIFQDPMTSLNPVYTIGNQIMSVIKKHQGLKPKEAREKAIKMLELVGIPSPEKRIDSYPFECSGGMKQRAMIAIALSCEPDLLIADEPTTALDVTIQAQILELMKDLKNKLSASIILISHDLGVVADVCSRIIVMYGGQVMEEGSSSDIFYNPKHPYTIGLLKAIPRINLEEDKKRLVPIFGNPPDLLNPPVGCPFAPRCKYTMNICMERVPEYSYINSNHRCACWLQHKDAPKTEMINDDKRETK